MMFSRLSGYLRALKSKAVSGSEAHSKSFDRLSAETVVENLRLDSHVEGVFFAALTRLIIVFKLRLVATDAP